MQLPGGADERSEKSDEEIEEPKVYQQALFLGLLTRCALQKLKS